MNGIKLVMLLAMGLTLASCTLSTKTPAQAGQGKVVLYTCSMHPQIIREAPGSCPVCGMPLVQKTGLSSPPVFTDLNSALMPVNSSVISTIPAVLPQYKKLALSTEAEGILAYDDRYLYTIASRYSGRIEKIYLTYGFQEIKKGQRIMDIYSPELVNAQQDLLYLTLHSSGESSLIQAAREKLLLLGMTTAQVRELLLSHRPFFRLPVFSPYEGHVHEGMTSLPASEGNDASGQKNLNSSDTDLKEGQYVTRGQVLFRIIDSGHLWAIFKMDRTAAATIQVKDPLQISFPDMPGKIIKARVDFIEPILETGDRNTSFRVYLPNASHELKVNSLLKAKIETGNKKGLWVPRTAVYRLGRSTVVWVKKKDGYRLRTIYTGAEYESQIEILHGLTASDSIASNAQFLADSETFLHTTNNE